MLAYQLLRPLAYLTIRDANKWKIDVLLPCLFAILMFSLIISFPIRPTIFGLTGFISQFLGLLQILPGFFLTALAAIATFNRPDMDKLMPIPIPTVHIKLKGELQEIQLTRRRMLSMLFGYLTFASFFLYFISVFTVSLSNSARSAIPADAHRLIADLFLGLFFVVLGQLIFVTMFGLYQLADRMHQSG